MSDIPSSVSITLGTLQPSKSRLFEVLLLSITSQKQSIYHDNFEAPPSFCLVLTCPLFAIVFLFLFHLEQLALVLVDGSCEMVDSRFDKEL